MFSKNSIQWGTAITIVVGLAAYEYVVKPFMVKYQ